MRLKEIMSRNVETSGPTLDAEGARARMTSRRIHHLVVLEKGKVLGIVSDRDLGGSRGATLRAGRTVADLMTRQVIFGAPDMTLRQAAGRLRGYAIGCLPVLEEGKLVGIVTISDLLALLARGAERPVPRARRWTLKHRGPKHGLQKVKAARASMAPR